MTTVRPATAADAAVIAELLGQLGYPTSPQVVPERLAAIDAQGGIVLLGFSEEGRGIGLASGSRQATLHSQ